MKMYKNKKFYNFKEVHKQKKRTRRFKRENGKGYKKERFRVFRSKSKDILKKRMKGKQVEFPIYKQFWLD